MLGSFDKRVRPQLEAPGWHVDKLPHHGPVHDFEGVRVVTLVLRAWQSPETESGECDQIGLYGPKEKS